MAKAVGKGPSKGPAKGKGLTFLLTDRIKIYKQAIEFLKMAKLGWDHPIKVYET